MTRTALWLTFVLAGTSAALAGEPFEICVVDEATGRGVPLVELKTVNNIRLYTDSNGVAAFHEPGLMDRKVFFHVSSHGYEFRADGFGSRGTALQTTPGSRAVLKIKRLNIAERLYRVTGAGIYRDTVLIGKTPPIVEPVLNAQVFGSDSVMNAVYRGKIYWFWGDTNRPAYPLGNFHAPGATSELPSKGGLPPETGVNLNYFIADDGFAKPTARMPGDGPTWIDAVTVLPGPDGTERLFAHYAKIKPPMTVYRHGLAEFDDEARQFREVLKFPDDAPAYPGGHPFLHTVDGVEYVYFATPVPLLRVRADVESLKDLSRYEAFSCLEPGSRLDSPKFDRDDQGKLRYGWKRNTPVVGPVKQAEFVKEGHLSADEVWVPLQDATTGDRVIAHAGSVYWNAFRNRWVMITAQIFGTSLVGETWYAEADSPLGPWVYATKIVTHDKYSFYNPKQHPYFDEDGGRMLYFEGTYTHTFSGNEHPTPRYDYNQIMYRIDLADPRLVLPVPVYRISQQGRPDRLVTRSKLDRSPEQSELAFFALDRAKSGTVGIVVGQQQGNLNVASQAIVGDSASAFFALPADQESPPETTCPLYEFRHNETGELFYTTDAQWSRPGFERQQTVCRVWKNPVHHWPLTQLPD